MHMKCEGRDDGELRVGDSSAALWLDCQAGIAGDMLSLIHILSGIVYTLE